MSSQALARFDQKLIDVDRLASIHVQLSGIARGRRSQELAVLNKSAIVLLTAAWETYIESVCEEAGGFMCSVVLAGPEPLRYLELQDLIKGNIQTVVNRLHTPSWQNVRDLARTVLGMPDITIFWTRNTMDQRQVRRALNEWLDDRHGIAHGAEDREFILGDVKRFRSFLHVTVCNSDKAIGKHVEALIGKHPWQQR